TLAPLPVQYADFAVWQRQWLTGDVLEGQLSYWRERLAGAPVLELPTDRPRPAVWSPAGDAIRFDVPEAVAERLRAVARDAGASMFMTLLSAFTVLLSRYSGQEDVVVGTPIAGRNRAEIEGLIGFFVNTLVLRTDLSGDPTFAELLARVRADALAAYDHQDLPFERLVDELEVVRDRSRTPLFQVLFNYFSAGEAIADDGGSELASDEPARFDLRLILVDDGTRLAGEVEYATALFDRGTVRRLVGHLAELLTAVGADADRRLSDLPLLTEAEAARLAGWNDTAAALPAAGGVQELIAARAAEHPDAVAVECGDRALTYGQLEARANRLAHLLRAAGVGAESVVGVAVERGVEMAAAIVGVWKAGAAYLPLDVSSPADRLAFMLDDAGASIVVGTAAVIDELPVGRLRTVVLDAPGTVAALATMPDTAPAIRVDPRQLAYVIYTSGSTGRPKGVQVPHGGVVNLCVAQQREFGVAAGEGVLQFASLGFDASVWEMIMALAAGARLVVAESGVRSQPGELARVVAAGDVRAATLPPSLLSVLAPEDLAGLRTIVAAGERLDVEVARRWAGGHRLINAYGPTESTVCASMGVYDPSVAGVPTIGVPIVNARLHVVDGPLRPVPAGVSGELLIGGAGVARGYAGRPDLTAERFIADPFAGDGSRLYRSGDVVRWRTDGQLDYLGRADTQLKVRGFRVEPGEIETVLLTHPAVTAAVVTADPGDPGRLVAYLVPSDVTEGIGEPQRLREHLRQHLPEYMLPAVFVELATIPMTVNGKVDHRALPGLDGAVGLSSGAAPRNPTETLLARIWGELLGLEHVGITDDFFSLGGHSLLATRLMSRIRAALGVEPDLSTLFEHPTIEHLAAVLDTLAPADAPPPITPVDRDRPLPLSFAQQRLWFLHRFEPGSVEYNMPMAVRLPGDVDREALAAALTALVARHEVLRTRLVAGEDGVPYQVVDPAPERFDLPVVGELGPEVPFDLAAGPLFRASLLRVASGECALVLEMHHVVGDEWSAGVLRRELRALYAGEVLAPLPVQYADFAVWQRQWLSGEVLEGQLGFWRERLAGAAVLDLPSDRPRPAVRSSAGQIVEFGVDPVTVAGLEALSRSVGATMFMTLLGAFATLLGRYSGQDDVVVGTPIAGRNRAEVEGLIGFFVNTLVLRTDLSGDPTFAELLGRVRADALAAFAHQDVPFERLVDELDVERDRSRTPLFQVFFSYTTNADNGDADAEEAADAGPEPVAFDVPVKFDLSLDLVERPDGGLLGAVQYATSLFDRATIQRLVGHLMELLSGVVGDAGRRLSDLSLLTGPETAELARWNDTTVDIPTIGGVHELISARAVSDPDVVAVVCGAERLTYGELESWSDGVAGHLAGLGVGPESVVGLRFGRGVGMVVAVLAVWKAGAAFVPLDPAYPRERLEFMTADAGVSIVLSEADLRVSGVRPVVRVRADQLAYVIYTSGSTGRPKGVQVTHGGVVNLSAVLGPVFGLGVGEAGLQFASFSFDAAVLDVAVVLPAGGTLVIAEEAQRTDPGLLGGLVRSAEVRSLSVSPSVLAGLDPADLVGVRTLFIGSEPMPAAVARKWSATHQLVNAYGPTETTVIATTGWCAPGDVRVPSIGAPIGNTRVWVLDEQLRMVPVGVPGQVFIGGSGLARGYAGQ
ncbi:amino acid adenylation domain-containing protein, partial [Dactylosporangium siamense]